MEVFTNNDHMTRLLFHYKIYFESDYLTLIAIDNSWTTWSGCSFFLVQHFGGIQFQLKRFGHGVFEHVVRLFLSLPWKSKILCPCFFFLKPFLRRDGYVFFFLDFSKDHLYWSTQFGLRVVKGKDVEIKPTRLKKNKSKKTL